MSLALYRKYRPGTLAEVRGQDHVTGPLRQALLNGRVHHAYLFSGPRGCGKTSSARILARSLNCEKGPTPDPCGECDSCVSLAPNGAGSLDVVEIDAASHGGVDDARDLRERAFFAPVSSRYKVYIIDEAHMVSREGFNALLKLVEEPPDFLRFVFATTEPEKVIGTIRSRTHHYPFRLMPRNELSQLLTDVVQQEGIAVDPTVVPLVVRAAAGSARDGLSILDQVLASAGAEGVTREGAAQLLGVTPDTLIDEVVEAFAAGDGAAVFATVDQVMESGHDPRRFTADVLERLRDLVVLAAVPEAGEKGLLDVPPDRFDALARQAAALGPAALSRAADLFHAGLTEMRGTTSPRLLLELLCARVLLPGAGTDDAAVLSRLERLERRLEIAGPPAAPQGGRPPQPAAAASHGPAASGAGTAAARTGAAPSESPRGSSAPTSEPSPVPAGHTIAAGTASSGRAEVQQSSPSSPPSSASGSWPTAAVPGGEREPVPAEAPAPPAAGGLDASAVRRAWDAVLDAANSRKRTTKALLMNAQVVSLNGRTLTLGFTTPALARTFQGSVNEEVLKESLQAVLGLDVDVSATVAGESAPAAPQAPAPPAYEGLAPGDEIEPVDPDEPEPERVVSTEDTAIALLEAQLGATVLRSEDT